MSLTPTHLLPDELYASDLTDSEKHELLAAEARRLALEALEGRTNSLELYALAEEIATMDEAHSVNDETVEQLAIALHHAHLPKMDDLGVLSYDAETNVVDPRLSP